MIASTARITRLALLSRVRRTPGRAPRTGRRRRGSLSTGGGRFRDDRDVREVQLGAAPGAQRVVELDDLPAPRAGAAQLVALGAVDDRGHQAEDRQDRADAGPQEERRALDAPD